MIKVSVIVPVYNVEQYIERCAHSLFSQSLDKIEYIFVNDCSCDNSIPLLESVIDLYPERRDYIRIVHHDCNKGLSAARKTGYSFAKGKYIAHCDSDDYVHRDMYRLLYEKAINNQADVVMCDFYFHYAEDKIKTYHTISITNNTNKRDILKRYLKNSWTVVWNILVKKSLYVKYAISFPEHITYCEDFFLSVRQLFFASKIDKVDLPLYYYNKENQNSIMHNLSMKSAAEEREVYLNTIDFFRNLGVFSDYEQEMSWRILKNKQDMVLDSMKHSEFKRIFPESHKYILSCPRNFCNIKIKIMMWLLTHHCRPLLMLIIKLRNL